jgi:hypothetical protein
MKLGGAKDKLEKVQILDQNPLPQYIVQAANKKSVE